MKKTSRFLIISLIAHLILFMVLTYIALPPLDRFEDSIPVEFVERTPAVRERPPVKEKVEPKKEPEQLEHEKSETPAPPEMEAFYVEMEALTPGAAREVSGRKSTIQKLQAKQGGMASVQPPLTVKPAFQPNDEGDIAVLPEFYQDAGNISETDEITGLSGSQLGPLVGGASGRGTSEQFISILSGAYYSTGARQQDKGDEFARILPELAQDILKRANERKVDIVFVIDTTGSMRDNVRGVKDYISHFLKPIAEKGFDARLGLVGFTDEKAKKARVFGITENQKKFKKWLDEKVFMGGDDIPESGYEALVSALEDIDFRRDAQKFFIFVSDAPQHDLDYDGLSRYTLDRIIVMLNDEDVTVDVVGANYLPVKQLAWGTGGKWIHIPGGDPLVDVPLPISSMIRSSLPRSVPPVLMEDNVTIEFSNPTPEWVDLSYKMLDPRGHKRLGTLTYRIKVPQKTEKQVSFSPRLDLSEFRDQPGTYTLIYRIRDSMGNRDILRRTFELSRH